MIILRNVKQINDIVNEIFNLDNKFNHEDYSFINEVIHNNVLTDLKPEKTENKLQLIDDLSSLVFQLNNYLPALSNLTNLFLITESYEQLFYFTTKIFYEHIGTIHYVSSEKSYNFMQKTFDRFIEIVKNCNIKKELYIPFILNLFMLEDNNKMSFWQEPAIEYLKKFEAENEKWVNDFIYNNKLGFVMLSLICYFSTQKGIVAAINYYNLNKNDEKVVSLFKDLKKEMLLHIDKELPDCDEAMLKIFAEILFSWGEDNEAKSRLEEIYKTSNDVCLRNEIAHKIGSVQLSNFKSEKNFLFAVRRNVKAYQERTLGLPFDKCNLTYKSGLKADFPSYTYLINLFKEENNLLNLEKFLSLENVFEMNSLSEFANSLFFTLSKKNDVNCAKWAIRLICVFAKNNLVENFVVKLFEEGRIKEGKYFLSCYIYAKNNAINLLKRLSQVSYFSSYKDYFVKIYSDFNNLNSEQIRERLLPEEFDENLLEEERRQLYKNFIAQRQYSQDYFDLLFIKNKLYNKLGQDIVFGEYKFGRLYSAFILSGKIKTFIYNNHIEDSQISIVHTIDCDERNYHLLNIFPNSKFNQFEKSYFNVNNFSRSQVSIQSMSGTVVNPRIFTAKLEAFGFVKNKELSETSYTSVVHEMPIINLVCEVEFESTVDENSSYNTLANIYFYRFSDCIKSGNKIITYKQNAVSVGTLPPRYFSHILSIIVQSIKEN